MLKVTIQGEPDEIAALFFHLEDSDVIKVQYQTGVSKRAEHHKWGSAKAGLQIEPVPGLNIDVSIWNKRDKSTKATPGYVYLMPYYGANGIEGYKIGKTTNPYSRRKTFSIKLNFKVEFIALISTDDYSYLVSQLHREFSVKRRGASEWFDLTADDVEKIKFLMNSDDKEMLAVMEGGK